ncbi:L-threonylcarbamoyladenylate synthase [bacterium]|jgi:L-threonylcarbamoyladenylate synthase|nr:L-threonylcarbamoyladenylate synthase [bacterium]
MKRLTSLQADEIAELLLSENVGVYPFDTIIGFIGIVNPIVEKKIASIKNRKDEHPFLILVDSLESAKKLVKIPPAYELFVNSVWPGPVTLVFEKKEKVSTLGFSTVAIRIPNDLVLRDLIRRVGGSVYSTSVNISGEKAFLTESSISESIISKIDFCVTAVHDSSRRVVSTIVDCTSTMPSVLREGGNVQGVKDLIGLIGK